MCWVDPSGHVAGWAYADVAGGVVLKGNGDGTFTLQSEPDYRKQKYARWQSVAAGDVNGDGKTDLVLGSSKYDEIHVLLSNGNGTFSDPYIFKVSDIRLRQPSAIALADFNNDGGSDQRSGHPSLVDGCPLAFPKLLAAGQTT
jgi:hypothetical protein